MRTRNLHHSFGTWAAASALALLLAASCTSEELITNPDANPIPGQQVTITASLGDASSNSKPGTRMDYTPDAAGTGLKTTWATGDAFNIEPRDEVHASIGTAQTFTLATGAGTDKGTFTGTAPVEGDEYYIFHPASIKTGSDFNNFPYTEQKQTGNDNRNHLTAFHSIVLITTDYTTLDFSSSNEDQLQSACMKFVLTPGAAITPVKITIASADDSKCFYTTNEDTNDTSILSLGLQNITLTGTTGDDGTITAYMMMSINEVILPAAGIIVTVDAADGSSYTQTITLDKETTLTGGKTHTIIAKNMKPVSTTYTNTTVASTFLYTADGTAIKAGTPTNPYLIQSAEDLKMVQDITNGVITANDTYKNQCYKLTKNITIDLPAGTNWTPIGIDIANPFTGTFDGDGHSVTGVYINTDQQYIGFFGDIEKAGKVMNLNVTGNITSTYNNNGYVGGIAGSIYNSYIIGCSYSGSITGIKYRTQIGGICGNVDNSCVIGCYNTSTVKSTQENSSYCGGIAAITGSSNTYIIGCYNIGAVIGTNNTEVGGIVAGNQGEVMGCYNTGGVTGTNENDASCGGILGTNSTTTTTTTGCLWVKSSAAGTATVGIGKETDAGTIPPIADIATLNSTDNIGILNAAITTWNKDSNGGGNDTSSPRYCHFKFEAGTDNATPVLVSTQQP